MKVESLRRISNTSDGAFCFKNREIFVVSTAEDTADIVWEMMSENSWNWNIVL